MSQTVTIWTLDWVPGGAKSPRGFVRDLRLRWACEELGLPYEVKTVPLTNTPAPEHLAHQPFGQVPWLEDNGLSLFESGACLLHLARKSELLVPREARDEAETLQWFIAALNSIEMATVPWWFIGLSGTKENPLDPWVQQRLQHLNAALGEKQWFAAGRFTVADLLMADVLRVPKVREALKDFPALAAYVERACARPAFQRAHAAQMEHFEKADQKRG